MKKQKIIEIDDLDFDAVSIYKNRKESMLRHIYEPDEGLFIAESSGVIKRALEAGYVPQSFLIDKDQLENAKEAGIFMTADAPVYTSDHKVLTQITGHEMARGMLCALKRRPLMSVNEVCAGLRRIAVLDDIENPTNIGALFRSVAALDMDAVILTGGCADPLYRRAARVSMGAVFSIPWTYIREEDYMDVLKSLGFYIVAMALRKDALSIDDERLKAQDKLAVVFGNEGAGLRESVINASDAVITIPMSHGVDSLNVAAAGAIAFWELGRKNI